MLVYCAAPRVYLRSLIKGLYKPISYLPRCYRCVRPVLPSYHMYLDLDLPVHQVVLVDIIRALGC